MPVGISRKPTSISGRLCVVDASASTPKPARSTSAPTIIGLRVPKRVFTRPLSTLDRKNPAVNGRNASPASSGV